MNTERTISMVSIVKEDENAGGTSTSPNKRCLTKKCLLIVLVVLILCVLVIVLLAVFITRNSRNISKISESKGSTTSKAKLVMECEMPHDPWAAKNGKIHDVCWWDVTSLIAVQGRQLLNLTVDLQNELCTAQVIDNSYLLHSISCLPPQALYASGSGHGIKMYSGGQVETWTPPGGGYPGLIATSNNYIVAGEFGEPTLSVYNKTREFLYEINIPGGYFVYTYLTEDDLLIATTWAEFKSQLLLYNLTTNTSRVAPSDWGRDGDVSSYSGGICTTPGGKLLVVDYGNRRVNAFTLEGGFLYRVLQWKKLYPGAISVLQQQDNSSLLAVSLVYPASKGAHLPHIIRLYTLQDGM